MQNFRFTQLLMLLILGAATLDAQAIPAFARQEGVKCSSCHNAWPQLNAKGRSYKENGYRFSGDLDEPRKLGDLLEDSPPLAALLVARPYDKKKSGDPKNRSFHEFELFAGGAFNDNWSGYAELEAEDETDFAPEVALGAVNYRLTNALNFSMGWAPYLWTDGYGLLGDRFKMTRGHAAAVNSAFGGADGGSGLRASRQVASLYGRPFKQLFYNVGYSGVAKDAEGEDASNLHARLAFDLTPNLMFGGFVVDGKNSGSNQNFTRTGVDFQADVLGARFQGAYIEGKDDVAGGGEASNTTYSLQAMYLFTANSAPTWVPVVRLDSSETNDGNDKTTELTLNLTRYFSQNIKGFIEYWKELDTPGGGDANDRITAQISLAF